MKLQIRKSGIGGEITVPGSKSHTIRAVAIAAMADGQSVIRAPLSSGDTISSLNAARAFGAEVSCGQTDWRITGTGGKIKRPSGVIDLGNSGTSLRIFTGLAALADFEMSFDGDASLRTRLMKHLLDALIPLRATVKSTGGKCPLTVRGPIRGGKTRVNGTSSQFLTSLLFAAPLAEGETFIEVEQLNEVPYVEITMDWLARQNINFEHAPDMSWFRIPGGQAYHSFDAVIPADFSTATFPLAAAAVTGGTVDIRNLDFNDRQGDKAVFDYFARMGVSVRRDGISTEVTGPARLRGAELDLNATPDALPAMAAAAALADGQTRLVNVPQARIKETDRIACMTRELRKMGASIVELPDGMVVDGGALRGAEVDGHGDHRIVMALAVAALAAEGVTTILGAEAAGITYPDFVRDFRRLGAEMNIIND